MKKVTIFLWFLTILGLFFYSFTQVDLNLTLIRHPLFNQIVKSFQYVGYFQRPLSTYLYLFLLLVLFLLYCSFLALAKKGKLSRREFWMVIIFTSVILLFSYPAFSYDIFNYMFDAKTIVFYHSNPWLYKPLYFVGDPWLHFMHWTHRPSIYPPVWIGLSLPFYFLGFNFFLPILFNFKILMALGFLGSIFVLEKLLKQEKEPNTILPLVFYAFSPLMLIENLVSGHNDIVMMFFVVLSFYFLTKKRFLFAFSMLFISIFVKYATLFLVPVFFYCFIRAIQKKTINWDRIWLFCALSMFVAFLLSPIREEMYPWYAIWFLPFVSLIPSNKFIINVSLVISFGLLLRYIPYMLFGTYLSPTPEIKEIVLFFPVALFIIYYVFKTNLKKKI